MYRDGQGVAKNLNEAKRLLELAANQNLGGAARALANVQRQLTQAQAAEPMSVEDFLLDSKQLDGEVVAVHGEPMCIGADVCILYASGMQPMQGITFDPTGLPREARRKLLECNPFLRNCSVTVTGLVRAGAFMANLVARQVEW
jgi:hypothetical protein